MTHHQIHLLLALVFFIGLRSCGAFATLPTKGWSTSTIRTQSNRIPFPSQHEGHILLTKQRRSVANIQTQGLFGLGAPEIAIILIAGAFLVGPQKIGSMVGKFKEDLDDVPDELKRIPEEFQKGLEEGEQRARARNAKTMEPVPDQKSLPKELDK